MTKPGRVAEKIPAKWTLRNVWAKFRLDALDYIKVCAECNQASCWLGEFYCQRAKTANVVGRTVRDLLKLGPLEHPEHWVKARIKRTRLDDGPLCEYVLKTKGKK